jgi:hypothetical protein
MPLLPANMRLSRSHFSPAEPEENGRDFLIGSRLFVRVFASFQGENSEV